MCFFFEREKKKWFGLAARPLPPPTHPPRARPGPPSAPQNLKDERYGWHRLGGDRALPRSHPRRWGRPTWGAHLERPICGCERHCPFVFPAEAFTPPARLPHSPPGPP